MSNNIDVFKKRWNAVTNETLSSVRRQLQNVVFDNSLVNMDFRDACAEWFDGKLAPHIWFQQLAEEQPEVAQKFKKYVTGIRLNEQSIPQPSQRGSSAVTALALPLCYFVLSKITEMGFVSKSVFSIGTAVLVWYACQSFVKEKQTKYEEQVVDLYRQQLDNHLKEIMLILS